MGALVWGDDDGWTVSSELSWESQVGSWMLGGWMNGNKWNEMQNVDYFWNHFIFYVDTYLNM